MPETERELHADFFGKWSNEAALAVADMDEIQLTAWRNEMAKIALEAKVKTSYADEKLRQKRAEKIRAGKPWLVPSESTIDEHGILTRQKRMSKTERILETLTNLGVEIDESFLKKLTDNKLNVRDAKSEVNKQIKLNEVEENLKALGVEMPEELKNQQISLKVVKFQPESSVTIETSQSDTDSEVITSEPFDFSKLGE